MTTECAGAASQVRLEAAGRPRAVDLDAAALVSGNTIYAASQWALLLIIAKLGSVVQVGQFASALAMTAPIFIFSQLQLRGLQATDAAREYSFAEYLSLRMATTAAAVLAVVSLVFMTTEAGPQRGIVLAMAVAKAIESIADVAHGRLQQLERLGVVAGSFASRGLGGLLAFSLAFAAWRDLAIAILGMTLWWVVSYAAIEGRALWKSGGAFLGARIAPVLRLAIFAAPMGVVMALSSLNIQLPRYFIEASLGTQKLGIFAGLAAVPLAGAAIVSPLCQAASARLARAYHRNDRAEFRRTVGLLLIVSGGIGAGIAATALLLGDRLITLMYSTEYAGYQQTFLMLVVWGTFSYGAAVLGTAVTAARRIRVQAPILATSTAVTALTAMFLVPRFGLIGAALAASLGALAQGLWFAVVLRSLARNPA
jgi:O-antigen/teichoic acid export membrane protein